MLISWVTTILTNSVIIYDWDDTLLCTTYLGNQGFIDLPVEIMNQLSVLDNSAVILFSFFLAIPVYCSTKSDWQQIIHGILICGLHPFQIIYSTQRRSAPFWRVSWLGCMTQLIVAETASYFSWQARLKDNYVFIQFPHKLTCWQSKLLAKSITYGDVFIITNAAQGWVEYSGKL